MAANAVDLWVLGLFQGEQGDEAYALLFAVGVLEMLRLGRLAEDAGYAMSRIAQYEYPNRRVIHAQSIKVVKP